MQLFSKGGQEADSGVRAASKPAAIKHDVKLVGFGAAARLNGQGCAILPSPYRSALAFVTLDKDQSPTGRHSWTLGHFLHVVLWVIMHCGSVVKLFIIVTERFFVTERIFVTERFS